ncbi:MAG: RluA family pseudouridine synthase [Alphaproteobacteria bacterium]|nr:RluA family pseudouridine synthase [Alphaproteobacteria bacterium]
MPTFAKGADARAFLIHEDPQVLVFDKPAGLSVQGGSGVEVSLDEMLAQLTDRKGRRPRLAHRLDRETSGVIVAGRTPSAIAALNQAFADRATEKTYLAIVCGGAPEPSQGLLDTRLVKTKVRGVDIVRAARDDESPSWNAETAYRTLAATEAAALVEARPHTGRMHQIRAHLALAGRPIAGDGKYGGLFSLGGAATPHLLLHALALRVPHPAGGALSIFVRPPAVFRETAEKLGLGTALPSGDTFIKHLQGG